MIRNHQKTSENGWQHQKRLAVRLAEKRCEPQQRMAQLDHPSCSVCPRPRPDPILLDCDRQQIPVGCRLAISLV